MNKSIIAALLISVAGTACSKVNDNYQDIKISPVDTTYKLNIEIPKYNIHYSEIKADSVFSLVGYQGVRIGYYLTFIQDSLRVDIPVLYDGTVQDSPTGTINGKPFIVYHGKMNVCGGQQKLDIYYSIFK